MEPLQTDSDRHQRIQLTAYYLWQQRGCPLGDPEVDWFRAEEQLNEANADASPKPTIVAVAEVVGSALGSVAGLVASVGGLVHSDEPSR
jgi:hypothetical protein